jgi:hypothetical protein
MKWTKAMSLFAALGVLLVAIVTIVSPVLDLDCGSDPGHLVASMGESSRSSNGATLFISPSPCDHQSAPVQPTAPSQHEGETVHLHGMTAHALVNISSVAFDLTASFSLPLSSFPRLSGAAVRPPVERPRMSA